MRSSAESDINRCDGTRHMAHSIINLVPHTDNCDKALFDHSSTLVTSYVETQLPS